MLGVSYRLMEKKVGLHNPSIIIDTLKEMFTGDVLKRNIEAFNAGYSLF